ncbi:hypothetical protein F5883DRAFT_384368, partial [Diaporthe sp. PMI_573]
MSTRSAPSIAGLGPRALHEFFTQPVSQTMVSYAASAVYGLTQENSIKMVTRQTSSEGVSAEDLKLPYLEDFIGQLLNSSNTTVRTLMSTLVYLNRLTSYIHPIEHDLHSSIYGIILASLVVATKWMNDITFTNKEWADFSIIPCQGYVFRFSPVSVNRAETNLLILLDWNVCVTNDDLSRVIEPFLSPLKDDIGGRN